MKHTDPATVPENYVAVSYKDITVPTLQTWERILATRIGKAKAARIFEIVCSSRYAELRWGNPIPLPPFIHEAVTWARQQQQ